jgi:hypothetical protein
MVATLGYINAQSTSSKEENKGQYECFKFQYENKDREMFGDIFKIRFRNN